ncbi:hypothetical protein V498_06543, partial [Pseudogymnoascus sp. VKM F-4517 (FW-2822)]
MPNPDPSITAAISSRGGSVAATPDLYDDDHHAATPQWHPMHDHTSPDSTAQPRATAPLQKRRRVTRACDECRRKKIKCDGKQPCTHCTVYSYECTFDQPSNRRRNPAPQYIEALETRLQRAEVLLRSFVPNIDLSDPNFEAVVSAARKGAGTAGQAHLGSESVKSESSRPGTSEPGGDDGDDAQLSSMIETTGQLELDERGHWDFHGGSSGAVFLQQMREQFDGLLGNDTKAPFLPRLPARTATFSQLESPRSTVDSPFEGGLPNTLDLPDREHALRLCSNALDCACALLRILHAPSFYEMFDRIYDTPPENFGDEENRFLPLLYSILALGSMFMDHPGVNKGPEDVSYKEGIDQGLKYFTAARQMMEITDCRDMPSLQAVLFMILFLQSSANLSTCYSYIGIALRSALRMGLHRNLTYNFNPIERESRRRAFWIIRKMDTYVSALLGFPKMLNDEDVDQELPVEVDDEYITRDAILPMPPGKLSIFAASNAHTKLMFILAKVIRDVYPLKSAEQCMPGSERPTYVVSHAKIQAIEYDLQAWLEKLPMGLRPGGDAPEDVVRVQQLLRMAYAHVQMMLYRPFLHYVSSRPPPHGSKPVDERSYACAAACVSVSRNIVHITAEMQRRGFLIGAYWFTMYTTFFAILSLAFFVLENPGKPGAEEIMENASVGRDTLKALARRSMAADRCSQSLTVLFEQLRLRLNLNPPAQTKSNKRPQPSHHLPSVLATPSASTSAHTKTPKSTTSSTPDIAGIQRARTFPTPPSNFPLNPHRRFAPSTSDPNLRASFDMRASTPSGGTSAGGGSTPDTPASMTSMGMGGLGLGSQGQQQGQ